MKLIVTMIILIMAQTPPQITTNTRKIDGVITEIDNEYVYIATVDGNGWVIEYADGYTVNDNVTITFDTLDNDDLYDDELINIETIQ